jgi:hypothetical protein
MLYLPIAHFVVWRGKTNVTLPVSLCAKFMTRGIICDNMFRHSPGPLLLLLFTASEFSLGGSIPYTSKN